MERGCERLLRNRFGENVNSVNVRSNKLELFKERVLSVSSSLVQLWRRPNLGGVRFSGWAPDFGRHPIFGARPIQDGGDFDIFDIKTE